MGRVQSLIAMYYHKHHGQKRTYEAVSGMPLTASLLKLDIY